MGFYYYDPKNGMPTFMSVSVPPGLNKDANPALERINSIHFLLAEGVSFKEEIKIISKLDVIDWIRMKENAAFMLQEYCELIDNISLYTPSEMIVIFSNYVINEMKKLTKKIKTNIRTSEIKKKNDRNKFSEIVNMIEKINFIVESKYIDKISYKKIYENEVNKMNDTFKDFKFILEDHAVIIEEEKKKVNNDALISFGKINNWKFNLKELSFLAVENVGSMFSMKRKMILKSMLRSDENKTYEKDFSISETKKDMEVKLQSKFCEQLSFLDDILRNDIFNYFLIYLVKLERRIYDLSQLHENDNAIESYFDEAALNQEDLKCKSMVSMKEENKKQILIKINEYKDSLKSVITTKSKIINFICSFGVAEYKKEQELTINIHNKYAVARKKDRVVLVMNNKEGFCDSISMNNIEFENLDLKNKYYFEDLNTKTNGSFNDFFHFSNELKEEKIQMFFFNEKSEKVILNFA